MAAESGGPAGTLLVIGGRIDTVHKAVDLGLDVVLVQHRDQFVPESAQLARAVIIADYTDWDTVEPLLVAAHQAYGFTAAVSLTEPGLGPATRVNDLLGLRGNSYEVSRLLKDKLAMRKHLAALGGLIAAASVAAEEATDEKSLLVFGQQHGYPLIVKPSNVTASLGVHRVDGPEDILGVWRQVEELRERTDLQWGGFFDVGPHIVEEYIDGPEYSIEAFSFDGRHVVVAVTEKLTSGFVELGHAQPARIDERAEAVLIGCTTMFLDAIGQTHGASHTEIKLTVNGPKIIEGHNRIGGDRIVDLLEAAYGVDFELLTVGVPFGLTEPLAQRPPLVRAAATRFLLGEPGEVIEVAGADAVREHPDVLALDVTVEPGSVIRPGSNWDRCGQVIAVGVDTDSVLSLCAELTERISIRTKPPADGDRIAKGARE